MPTDPRHVAPDPVTGETPSQEKAATTSLGDLIAEVSSDVSVLMRQELELAKAELRQSATRAAKASALYGAAAVAAMLTLLFLSIALWWALGYLVGNAWSALIVAAVWAVVGLVLALVGKRKFDEVRGMPETVETLKKIPDTLKRNEENR